MFTIKHYLFPTLANGVSAVERKRSELLQKARRHLLDNEELDWLDWAERAIEGEIKKTA